MPQGYQVLYLKESIKQQDKISRYTTELFGIPTPLEICSLNCKRHWRNIVNSKIVR